MFILLLLLLLLFLCYVFCCQSIDRHVWSSFLIVVFDRSLFSQSMLLFLLSSIDCVLAVDRCYWGCQSLLRCCCYWGCLLLLLLINCSTIVVVVDDDKRGQNTV
jgi:hypothetical protein